MVTVSIIWLIVTAIIEVIYVFAMSLDITTYYSNYMIYVGYILIIIFAVIGFKLFGSKGGGATPAAAPAEKPAATPPATPPS
jgi:hypothetical protein